MRKINELLMLQITRASAFVASAGLLAGAIALLRQDKEIFVPAFSQLAIVAAFMAAIPNMVSNGRWLCGWRKTVKAGAVAGLCLWLVLACVMMAMFNIELPGWSDGAADLAAGPLVALAALLICGSLGVFFYVIGWLLLGSTTEGGIWKGLMPKAVPVALAGLLITAAAFLAPEPSEQKVFVGNEAYLFTLPSTAVPAGH